MGKLFIIADDFTGALDTGVQFAARGAVTRVVTDLDYDFKKAAADTQVLVLDAETRHLPAEEAYQVVFQAVRKAREAGMTHLYKKTDSALRGNIGSELAAVMDAMELERLPFIPAFPAVGRTTRDGVQYVDGVPVAESVFGKDPFEPVRHSFVPDILAEQTQQLVTVRTVHGRLNLPGIQVFDAETDETLHEIGQMLSEEGVQCYAGCAGFAAELAQMLKLEGAAPQVPPLEAPLFVACGSVNPVTKRQLEYAEQHGVPHVQLTAEQKLNPLWTESADCQTQVKGWLETIRKGQGFLLDSNDAAGSAETERYMQAHGLQIEQVRVQISNALGQLMKHLLDGGLDGTLMCTGGDTLLAMMRAVHVGELTPVCELASGVVLTSFRYREKQYHIISKSGGFGEPDLLCRLAAMTNKKAS